MWKKVRDLKEITILILEVTILILKLKVSPEEAVRIICKKRNVDFSDLWEAMKRY